MRTPVQDQVYVWDPFVRLFHWSLVVGFTVAYLTEDDMLTVHVWAGYAVGLLIVAGSFGASSGHATRASRTLSIIPAPLSATCAICS